MTARAGGEADKFGNRYEGRWTVWHLLEILSGNGIRITVEPIGDEGDGAEFVYERADGQLEAHQVKRTSRSANNWTVRSFHALSIWMKAAAHVSAGRDYHFLSIVPAIVLQSLCDKARQSNSSEEFVKKWLTNDDLLSEFNELCKPDVYGSAETAWANLRGIWIDWTSEMHLVHSNAVVSELLLSGAPGRLAAAGLAELIFDNLGTALDAAAIEAKLAQYGLNTVAPGDRQVTAQTVVDATERWSATVRRELLDPPITRAETQTLLELLHSDGSTQVAFLAGTAGGGKSAVLAATVGQLQADDVPVLALRLDRVDDFASTKELGQKNNLTLSPVAALAAAAGSSSSVLVIDQLDAVSLASGRLPDSFNAVADLVDEARAFSGMKVVLACRQFDIDNDHRIRGLQTSLKADTVSVSALSDDEIDAAVSSMGLDASALRPSQREVLRVPLHLVLLAGVASEKHALEFHNTAHLFEAYWNRKRRAVRDRKPSTRFNDVVSRVATAISDRQRLSVSDTILDADDLADDADVLVSEHILVRDSGQVAFFHEAFFDFAFARQWESTGESLLSFLIKGEQELFRRAQVRQIMFHLRQRDTVRFEAEVRTTLLSDQARFHVKDAMVAVLGGLGDPTSAELQLLVEAAQTDNSLATRIWAALRSGPWFARADADGLIDTWLSGTEDEVNRAIDFLSTGSRTDPNRAAQILLSYRAHESFEPWLRWIIRFAPLHQSRSLFELLVEAVVVGTFQGHEGELWLHAHDLAKHKPIWAIELAEAYFVDAPNALALDESGQVSALQLREHSASELLKEAATAEPEAFVAAMLPYMINVMELTAREPRAGAYPPDSHFSSYYPEMTANSEADDALLVAMRSAIEVSVKRNAEAARPVLETLAGYKLASAQWLLYCGLAAGPEAYADWAADLLISDPDRLFCQVGGDYSWMPRLVIQAITPHLNDAKHHSLEDAVRDLRYEWERRARGAYAFPLLSALDEARLTDLGRRRLGEYRRAFGEDQPGERGGIIDVSPRSPISSESARHMADGNWLQAIARHSEDARDWTTSRGGAHELASVLKEQTTADPVRFAKLALRLTSETNTAYTNAILWGLQGADVPSNQVDVVFDCVRYIAQLRQPDNDRWLAWALHQHLRSVPLDIVELIRDRAVNAPDPIGDREIDCSNERAPGERLQSDGMNSARGSLAEALGNMLVYDSDGTKTAAVVPALPMLAADPVVSVRGQAAHTIGAALRFARAEAVESFSSLVDTDDSILTVPYVRRVLMIIGNGEDDASPMLPLVERMLASTDDTVRQCGGQVAVHAALEWGLTSPLDAVMSGTDEASRKGVAQQCAVSIVHTRNVDLAMSTLEVLFDDDAKDVREAAAGVAGNLRNHPLVPYSTMLESLIGSAAYEAATPQLFITLQNAPDRVDVLALRASQRFIEVSGEAAGDMRTGAAGDAHYVSDLAIRGLAQAREPAERSALLDVIDGLMKVGAYGVDEAVDEAGR